MRDTWLSTRVSLSITKAHSSVKRAARRTCKGACSIQWEILLFAVPIAVSVLPSRLPYVTGYSLQNMRPASTVNAKRATCESANEHWKRDSENVVGVRVKVMLIYATQEWR